MSNTSPADAPGIVFLEPGDPPDSFPDPCTANADFDGLLAIGGDLSPARLLAAYRLGIFPWYEEDQPILWWSPDPRAVLEPGKLRVSRSLRKTLRSDRFRVSVNNAFEDVIDACAATRATTGTWITPAMRSAYLHLHELGFAHAVETWHGSRLVGGLYGIALGGVFFGESMFSHASDASKVALVALVRQIESRGLKLIDCQVATAHLGSLGSELIPRAEFVQRVRKLAASTTPGESWHHDPAATSSLVTKPPAPARLQD